VATIQSIEECPPLPVVEGIEIRHCPNWLGYAVSNNGRVWSIVYTLRHRENLQWRELKQRARIGYRYVKFFRLDTGVSKIRFVSNLVAEAFIGSRPTGMHVCHNDGNRVNNSVSNLRYDTPKGNHADALRQGTHPGLLQVGERHSQAKVTNDIVRQIRELKPTMSCSQLGRMFGISAGNVSAICTKKLWGHVE
jgi:hypothetical protein